MSDGARPERPKRGDWPWLASLLLVGGLTLGAFALTAHRFTGGQPGVPLDDAWIHFQFARNLARGDGFSFNPGHATAGSTAPLWTALLAALYLVGGEFPVAGQLLSGACFLAVLAATYALGKRLTGERWAGWLAGMVVAANGRMVWAGLSGLETCLFAALSLLAIRAHLNDRAALRLRTFRPPQGAPRRYRLCTAALFGLAALARPEGYLLFALSLADFMWSIAHAPRTTHHASRITHHAPRTTHHASLITFHVSRFTHHVSRFTFHALRIIVLPTALFTANVFPYLTFSLHTSGHLLPNTYHAKAVFDFRPDLDFLSLAARYLILDNPLLLPFYVLGLGALLSPVLRRTVHPWPKGPAPSLPRGAPLLSLWSVGLPLVYAFLHAALYQHGRYLIPLIPCNAVVGVVGLLAARRLATRRGYRWRGSPTALVVLVSLLVVAGTAWRLPTMARLYAWNVDNVNDMHVAIGHWVAAHAPPDAVLALNDVGAITYVSERPVVDLAGLVTPEVVPLLRVPDRDARLADFMVQRNVQYVIIFPDWFPDLAARDDLLEPVHQVTLAHNTIAGGQTMVVYRAHWRR